VDGEPEGRGQGAPRLVSGGSIPAGSSPRLYRRAVDISAIIPARPDRPKASVSANAMRQHELPETVRYTLSISEARIYGSSAEKGEMTR